MNTFIITSYAGDHFITSGNFRSAAQALKFASSDPEAIKAMDDIELHEEDRNHNEVINAGADYGVFTSEDWEYLKPFYHKGYFMQQLIKTAYEQGFIGQGKELRNAEWRKTLKPMPKAEYLVLEIDEDFDFLSLTTADILAA